jgi:hypothetical protein
LDLDRCKNKCLLEICFYSDADPKLTALLINSINTLMDLHRCKNKCLVVICFYSDTGPKLLLDQERLIFCPNLLLMKLKGQFWDEKGQAGSRGVENTLVDRNIFHLKRRADT